ncbi:MAG: GNAT family N-acetyltransferase [Cystobacterineae bacterium]|nr:GNAT family N-acetyltransferase [Cystobacterineae bacterium]
MQLELRVACEADTEEIVALVNGAYHPASKESCWTHESNLIFGRRTTPQQVLSLFREQSAILLLCLESKIVACVHVETNQFGTAYIGMLATEPQRQTQGLGKQMLLHAESYAKEHFKASTFKMLILSARPELLAFYERRGYVQTGEIEEYPFAEIGQPIVSGLHFLSLMKTMPKLTAP